MSCFLSLPSGLTLAVSDSLLSFSYVSISQFLLSSLCWALFLSFYFLSFSRTFVCLPGKADLASSSPLVIRSGASLGWGGQAEQWQLERDWWEGRVGGMGGERAGPFLGREGWGRGNRKEKPEGKVSRTCPARVGSCSGWPSKTLKPRKPE